MKNVDEMYNILVEKFGFTCLKCEIYVLVSALEEPPGKGAKNGKEIRRGLQEEA